ncbi:hypothetical protein IC619_011390 [Hazenella sp. IB182353]|uniref:hypothetical protein n=1 Tax=Polycladospora coralii TaxID=2771432 RepID=UPI001747D1DE|nr:hypothetical protein [Polycladospora coralii]MBS7531098.1 hypothetical protein [Polycladospora coralii]
MNIADLNKLDKLITVNGKGRTAISIVEAYMELIREKGFDLTIDDIARYLRCSYGTYSKSDYTSS